MLSASSPDAASPDALAESHVRLAFHVARQFLTRARALGIPREDLLQEAVIGLLRASHGFRPEVGTRFGVFASVAIRNHLLNFISERRQRPFRALLADRTAGAPEQEDHRGQQPHSAAALADDRAQVGDLMRLLNRRERFIVRLYFWNDLSFARIGALVGLSGERVRQIFERSLRRLRRATDPRPLPPPQELGSDSPRTPGEQSESRGT
jgi:RNA polymerase sigma factor (sigma-70 family)